MTLEEWKAGGSTFPYRQHSVFYREDGAGPALLLIHGFPTASWDWHKLWPGLSARRRVLSVDMLGFGFSAKPRRYAYSIFDQADLMERLEVFLRARGALECDILAHDYGDTVAQELLARQQEGRLSFRIRSLCLLNGGIIPSAHRARRIQKLLNSPIGAVIGALMNEKSFRQSFNAIFGADTPPTETELRDFWELVERDSGRRIMHLLIKYITERRENADRWVTPLLRPGIPLKLIFGADDPISGQHMIDAYRALGPEPAVEIKVLEGIGHYPQTEAPDVVLAEVQQFLEKAA